MTNGNIYVISSEYMPTNYYKIGKCVGDKYKLRNRYITALIDVDIEIFHRYDNHSRVEKYIHILLSKYRVRRKNKTYSEWFVCDLETIRAAFDKINLVDGHDTIGYHNYKELKIKDGDLIGKSLSTLNSKVLNRRLEARALLEEKTEIVREKIEIDDKDEEDRINEDLFINKDQIDVVKEYNIDGDISCDMTEKTTLSLFLTNIVCGVKKINVYDSIELPMLLKQKLSMYKDDKLSDKVCKLFYKDRDEMDNHIVEDLLTKFKLMCKEETTVDRKMFNQKKNLHVYERLGFYSGIGMYYNTIVRRVMYVNDKKKQIGIPQIKILWKLQNTRL